MKENILVIFFLLLQISPSTSISGLSILNGASNAVGGLNSGLGMISRSKSVNAVSQMLRGEDSATVRESLAQAVTTLAVLDIGGGALVPVTTHIIEAITRRSSFKATMQAWGVYNKRLKDMFNQSYKKLSEDAMKRLLNHEKGRVLQALKGDVGRLQRASKTLNYINRAKRWFHVKTAAQVLGPLFDSIGIGVNSWALGTAKLKMIQELDRNSRLQLYTANKFMANNKITRGDFYVVNQGQLPRWIDPNKKLEFGNSESENPRKIVRRPGVCEKPIVGYPSLSTPIRLIPKHDPDECPLLVDGKNINGRNAGDDVGHSFYGFTSNARTLEKEEPHQPNKAYSGSMILINTNEVQSSQLKKEGLDETLRSIYIDTSKKGNYKSYDDVVALGNMKNLDRTATVTIDTGNGNDVLNIDGFVSVYGSKLHGKLGPGFNTLSFLGMPDKKDSEIRGIEYNPFNYNLAFFIGKSRRKDTVGNVGPVSVLGGSPFEDIVYLFTDRKGQNSDDFTVIKFKGKATYVIDIDNVSRLSSGRYWAGIKFTPHFKIIVSTDNGRKGERMCENHNPLLKITNFGS